MKIHYLIFILVILVKDCWTFNCNDSICPQSDETRTSPILPPIKVGGKTYQVETFFNANWYRAIQFCAFNGMRLASISNQEENDKLVEELLRNYDALKGLRFWMSGNDLAVNGTYFWLSTGADFQFQNWEPNQPDHSISGTEEEHCVEMIIRTTSNDTIMWNDRSCSTEQLLICEF